MSEPTVTESPNTNTKPVSEMNSPTNLKRLASEEVEDSREAKASKLEIASKDQEDNIPHVIISKVEQQSTADNQINEQVDSNSSTSPTKDDVTALGSEQLANDDTFTEDKPAVLSHNQNPHSIFTDGNSSNSPQIPSTQASNVTSTAPLTSIIPALASAGSQQSSSEHTQHPPSLGQTPILNLQNAPAPPAGFHLLTEDQQQQLLQSYVQAQQGNLANFTASSLAQAMVSPIGMSGLASNILHQLQQGGNVITALPGPPHQLPHHSPIQATNTMQQQSMDEAQGAGKQRPSRNMSNDERRQRRLLRNRVAAKECRKKKKLHIHEMEEKIVELEQENAALQKEVEELKAKLSLSGGMQNSSENYRLMKEVEELNARLGMNQLPPGSIGSSMISPSPTSAGHVSTATTSVAQNPVTMNGISLAATSGNNNNGSASSIVTPVPTITEIQQPTINVNEKGSTHPSSKVY